MKHPDQADYVVGVVGCGAMGQGIAQVSAQGGMRTLLFDAREGGANAAKDAIAVRINRLVEKGRIGEADADAAIARLEPVGGIGGLADADCVVEAVFEDLDVKHSIFKELEGVVRPDCILSSNTSSIPLASIARVCGQRSRVAGLHFFNPVPLMKLVEVIRAAETSDETVANLMALGRRMTRTPVEVKDAPGFLVNMGGRAYTTEALRIVHDGVATPAQVDAIMRDCWGFRMGPFELMDLTGIDVNYPVSQIIYDGYNQDPRLKTSANHKAMFDAGLFGRKTGQGWFSYENGKPLDRPSADFVTGAAPTERVAIVPSEAYLKLMQDSFDGEHEELSELDFADDLNPEILSKEIERIKAGCAELGLTVVPDDGKCPIIASPNGLDATTVATESQSWTLLGKIDPARLVCVDLSGDISKRVTVMTAPGADASVRDGVAAAIAASGRQATVISDSPGFVGPRMVAMVGNLGCYMAEIGLATPEDIDTAMQLGLNYPLGSMAFTQAMGPDVCMSILSGLHEITGDDRYRPTTWLKRRAALGLSL
ncbi:MAG: 3-hydroxyacyl-CoA dehydrogenase, partial [Pseudomonadota bacterium]